MPTPRRAGRSQAPLVAFDLRTYRSPKGYVRVSTDEQAEEGTSIDLQIQQIKAYAGAHGFTLTERDIYVDDGWSGKNLDRPALLRLRSDAAAGAADCVLVAKLDRLSRNLRDMVNLCLGEWQDEAPPGRQVVLKSISEPFDTQTDFGRMVFGLLAMFAEFERRRIAERTWSGKASRAEAGRNAGHRAPYGFRLAAAPEGGGSTFALVGEEAAMIRRIADMYLGGFGYQQVAGQLNEEGLRFRRGRLWQAQHVARILANPLIAGRYAYGRSTRDASGASRRLPEAQWVVSKQPAVPSAIVSPSDFARIKGLRQSRRRAGRSTAGTSLLAGLVRCGRCGAGCGVKTSDRAGRYKYYRCVNRKQSGPAACDQPLIRVDELDHQVLAAIRAVLLAARDAVCQRAQVRLEQRRTGLAQALGEAAAEEQRLACLRRQYFAWLEQGQMRPDAVQERLDAIASRLQEVASERARLEADLTALEAGTSPSPPRHRKPGSFAVAWNLLTVQERRRLVAALVARVEIAGRNLTITWAHDLYAVHFRKPTPGSPGSGDDHRPVGWVHPSPSSRCR